MRNPLACSGKEHKGLLLPVHTTHYIRWTTGDILISGQWWTYGPILYEMTSAWQSISFIHQSTAPSMYMWLDPLLLLQNFTSQNPTDGAHILLKARFHRQVYTRKTADHKGMTSNTISCIQHIVSTQHNWHIRFQLMYFPVSVWFLNTFILPVQESETSIALTKVNMCCHLWETIKLVIKERDKR
jgi:hypothetical protein